MIAVVPLDELDERLAPLRGQGGRALAVGGELADLPARAVVGPDGRHVLVDGFKRVARWRAEGRATAEVVLERAASLAETRALVLLANAPRRTLTAMDEARVVRALREEDGYGPQAIERLLGRKPAWVASRLLLSRALAPSVAARVDEGRLGPSLALALCGVARGAQEHVARAVERHSLSAREGHALVRAWRAAASHGERAALVREPLRVVRPAHPEPVGSALAAQLGERLARIRAALAELATWRLPDDGLAPAERRALEAEHRRALHQLTEVARATTLDVERGAATSPPEDQEHVHDDEQRRPADAGTVPDAGARDAEPGAAAGAADAARGVALAGGAGQDPGPLRGAPGDARDRPPDGDRPACGTAGPGGGRPGRDELGLPPPAFAFGGAAGEQARPLP
jgi:hypothetical protein